MLLIVYQFYEVTLLDTITVTCLINLLLCCALFHFDVTKMSGISEHQKLSVSLPQFVYRSWKNCQKLSLPQFVYRSWKNCMWIVIIFVIVFIFVSLWKSALCFSITWCSKNVDH